MHNTTDATFMHDVLNADRPVVVDFWADWCGPCKVLSPTLGILERELGHHVRFSKLDIVDNPETPKAYNVKSIPTLIVFRDKEEVFRMVGAVSKELILSKLTDYGIYPPTSEIPI
jgi:thioredoxin 1